jgi:hypothetical protein
MEKYLFNDGTNVVREVQSKEELDTFIQSAADKGLVKIWLFNTSQWISYAEFIQLTTPKIQPPKKLVIQAEKKIIPLINGQKKRGKLTGLIKTFVVLITVAAVFLIYNFSRERWHTASSLSVKAVWPANTPVIDIDSLIKTIENARGQKLDKVTQTNLRIRNSWPERIELKLKTDRDTSQSGNKFYNIELSIDNSTGYMIDEAVVELTDWRHGHINMTDTFHFNNVGYAAVSKRLLANEYRSDSLSLSFLTLRSRAFNFCYSFDKESNYGNLNDRWFCRD